MARAVMALGAAVMLGCLGGCATLHATASRAKPLDAAAAVALDDEQIARRLTFVIDRLDANRSHAQWWTYGFLAVNVAGMAGEAAAATTEQGSDRDESIIESGKALIGTIYMLAAPLPGRRGADPVRELPSATHEERAAQLAQAESILYAAKLRGDQRTGWGLHVGNVAVNAAGAVPLLAEGSYGNAAMSFFIDVVVGEAEILLTPWQPASDWQDYEDFVERGSVPEEPRAHWQLRPNGRGVAVELDF